MNRWCSRCNDFKTNCDQCLPEPKAAEPKAGKISPTSAPTVLDEAKFKTFPCCGKCGVPPAAYVICKDKDCLMQSRERQPERPLPIWPHGQWWNVPKYEMFDLLISAAMSDDPRCRTSAAAFFEVMRTAKGKDQVS